MAENSQNNRSGYQKDNDRNSSRPPRSTSRSGNGGTKRNDSGNRGEGEHGQKRSDGGHRHKKPGERKPFDKNKGNRRFDNRQGKGGPSKDKKFSGKGPRKNFDRNTQKHSYQGDRTDSKFKADEVKNPSGDYRPSKNAPEIDTDVTGKELENWTLRALRQLEPQNAETVAKHLVMVGRYLDIDPDFALEHAIAASKRAGRIGIVREVVGIAAYAAENSELTLRELRTHRRISGANDHLALLVDSERALGRIEKALTLAEEAKNEDVPAAVRSEVAIVVSGIYQDRGELKKAIQTLEIPELNPKRGFDYSPRLFRAYADLLQQDGRAKEAARWGRLALMTEAALGQGDFVEPEIFDIFTEQELLEPEEPSVDLEVAETQASAAAEAGVAQEPLTTDEDETFFDVTEPAPETVIGEEQTEGETLSELTPAAADDESTEEA